MCGDYGQIGKCFRKGCKALGSCSYDVLGVWVPAAVENGDEPELLYFFVYGEHSLLMGGELLILGMEFDAAEPERLYPLYLPDRVLGVGVDSAAAVKPVPHYFGSPVVDGGLL